MIPLLEHQPRPRLSALLAAAAAAALIATGCTLPTDPTGELPTARPDTRAPDTAAPPTDGDGEPDVPTDCPAPASAASVPLRAATFNVQRLFDTTCDSGRCGVGQWEATPSPQTYRQRIDRIADALADLQADVLLLQELETRQTLVDLADALASRGRDYPVRAFGEIGREASVDVAILARGTMRGEAQRYREDRRLTRPDGSKTAFSREFLGVEFDLDGQRIIAFTSHFKSKVDDDPGRRLAEARAARDIVSTAAERHPDALVIFGGDINDVPGSRPLEALTTAGDLRLAGADRPRDATWSYCYQNSRQRIDHLFWAPNCGGRYVDGSARAWGTRRCPARQQLAGSDHAAVSADFEAY